jgi:hypothetical protein
MPANLYQQLLAAERQLTDMTSQLPIAEACGVECQAYREKLRKQLSFIANLKANYAPANQ